MDPTQSLIPLLILVPLVGAALVLMPQVVDRKAIWTISLVFTVATFVISLVMAVKFDWRNTANSMQMQAAWPWISSFGLSFSYGVDSISLWLVLLTTLIMPICVLSSLSAITERVREYYFWMLLIESVMIGVFVSTDVILFYVFFEFTLIPLYFLILLFGSSQRQKASTMFFLYTFTGSMLTFAGVLYVAWFSAQFTGTWSFNMATLTSSAQEMTYIQQAWVLAALLAGFAVKIPLWPVHTWLPLAHTEAPTAGSVILASVLLKLGTYGLLRLALPMCPEAVVAFAPYIGAFAVCGILLAALVCWVQKDIKKLIAYSSVSHLGFCVLGLFALDPLDLGAVGSVMYMINHGLSTGALFLCVGMIYERFHTREMAALSGLGRVMPVWSFFFVFFVMASVGLPGLNGFVGEFLTLLGAFLSPAKILGVGYAVTAGLGLIFGAIYLLYMVGQVVFGAVKLPTHSNEARASLDLNGREVLALAPLAVACLVLGLQPLPLLSSLEHPVSALTHPAKQLASVSTARPKVVVRKNLYTNQPHPAFDQSLAGAIHE